MACAAPSFKTPFVVGDFRPSRWRSLRPKARSDVAVSRKKYLPTHAHAWGHLPIEHSTSAISLEGTFGPHMWLPDAKIVGIAAGGLLGKWVINSRAPVWRTQTLFLRLVQPNWRYTTDVLGRHRDMFAATSRNPATQRFTSPNNHQLCSWIIFILISTP